MKSFVRDCTLLHEGPLQGKIKHFLRTKNMLGGEESLENRVLRFTELTFSELSDCCMEPRLAHLFWARKCEFSADSGLAFSYIERIAKNVIINSARADLRPANPLLRKYRESIGGRAPKRESVPYRVLALLGEFFERSHALRESLSSHTSIPVFSDDDFDAEPVSVHIVGRVCDEHFRNGEVDRVWLVFWARIVQGMPREEAAGWLNRDVLWVRKRESELRKTIIQIVSEIKDK